MPHSFRTRSTCGRGSCQSHSTFSQKPGSRSDVVGGRNRGRSGAFYYIDAFLAKGVAGARYSLKVSVARR